MLTITKNERKTQSFWNPLNSYRGRNNSQENASSVISSSLNAWVQPYKNICVSLSGGLDSSALIYCLKNIVRPNQTLKALNYFHSQIQSSNELPHARKVCEETNVDLIEIDLIDTLPFDPSQRKYALKPNKPFPGLISLRLEEIIYEQFSKNEDFTFISGHGSDHIFMRPPTKKALFDYIVEQGIKWAHQNLNELTHFYRDSTFSIIIENLKALPSYLFGFKQKKGSIIFQLNSIPKWISQNVMKNAGYTSSHPIYDDLPKRILPGKFNQIDAVYEGLNSIHVEIMNQADPTFFPYLYQPVVDYALSIPTYFLFDKGYDRYPLRQSISEHFKTQHVWRRDKSETTGIFQLGIKKNIDYLQELCFKGYFVSNGLVDQKGLQNTINLVSNGDVKNLWPLIHLTSLEIFIKQWEEKSL